MAHAPDGDRNSTKGPDPPARTDGSSTSETDTSETESGTDIPVDDRSIQLLAGLFEGSIDGEDDLSIRGTTPAEVETELREVHLPKLEAAGFIDWDPETGTIEKGPRFEELALELKWGDWDDPENEF